MKSEKWAEHEKNFLPYVLFGQLKPYLDKNVNNILAQECGLYSDKYRVAGRVDCIAKYNNVNLSLTSRLLRKNEMMNGTSHIIYRHLHMQKCLKNELELKLIRS